MTRLIGSSLLMAIAGCAHLGAKECRTYEFPPEFVLLQKVRIESRAQQRELLVSVRRTGEDFDFGLMEPAFQRPVGRAARRNGEHEATFAAPAESFPAPHLFEEIAGLFSAGCFQRTESGALRHTGRRFRFEFAEPAPGPCAFPQQIEVERRRTPQGRIILRTEDVACQTTVVETKVQYGAAPRIGDLP